MARRWEAQAERWLRWARTPDFDAYWYYRDAFFDRLVPAPSGRTLEVGCGEGRVARDLRARGHTVVGVDSSPALVGHAVDADPEGAYVVADAASLPFPGASFDLVVAYNSLMDVDDLDGTLAEAVRVMTAGGRLCVCVTHPIGDAGHFEDSDPMAPFVIDGAYLGRRRRSEAHVEQDGLEMSFSGWAAPLEAYGRAFEAAGLLIEALREPVPAERAGGRHARWRRVPLFVHLRCRRVPGKGKLTA